MGMRSKMQALPLDCPTGKYWFRPLEQDIKAIAGAVYFQFAPFPPFRRLYDVEDLIHMTYLIRCRWPQMGYHQVKCKLIENITAMKRINGYSVAEPMREEDVRYIPPDIEFILDAESTFNRLFDLAGGLEKYQRRVMRAWLKAGCPPPKLWSETIASLWGLTPRSVEVILSSGRVKLKQLWEERKHE
jgi:hypothetical protein